MGGALAFLRPAEEGESTVEGGGSAVRKTLRISARSEIVNVLLPALLSLLLPCGGAAAAEGWKSLPEGTVSRIAFGSCAKHWQPQPIWETVIAAKPDLWLFLGDTVYADTDGATAWLVSKEQLAGEWNRLADKPEFQKARATIPMMATWDNHDYGSHAGGGEFPVKEDSKEAFLAFFEEPEDSPRRTRSGIYDAKIFGPEGKRVQVILLDTKYNRSSFRKDPTPKEERLKAGKVGGYLPDDDPGKTHLGEEQWRWLEGELKKPADLRLLCSSTQVVPDEKGMDEWGNFPRERRRLFDLIDKTGAEGVIILSGNVHFAELSKSGDGPYPLYDLTSSGMTHITEAYAKAPNRHRVKGSFAEINFGLVEIDWEAKEVTLKAVGLDGGAAFEYHVPLDTLQPGR
jgi:alkaline phosphatase D